jgi:hypothetical protein
VSFKTQAKYYWRERGKEVDFISGDKELLPIEVKYKKVVRIKELRYLLNFMERFKVERGLVVTEDYEGDEKVNGKLIKFVPLWKWVL